MILILCASKLSAIRDSSRTKKESQRLGEMDTFLCDPENIRLHDRFLERLESCKTVLVIPNGFTQPMDKYFRSNPKMRLRYDDDVKKIHDFITSRRKRGDMKIAPANESSNNVQEEPTAKSLVR